MLEIEIDGRKTEVADGSTVMDAAHQLGIFVPHFCYHKKLSIAANCRMCLVQVEKAPKPLPACATPVTNGMKVFTHSEAAVKAQKGVMEFLLINHPLDCPICDQGGECQLQDLSVGYGQSASRYQEEKRVVVNKNLGPLIATDMTRCIHCTRCVRFTQEIAGWMELGQAFRGEHAEIMPFIEKTVDSELSGNVIDLCPVGALTSKPFRFAARTWELSRRKSVSPHDGLGANLIVQVKHDKVLRVLPLENEAVNECWLSDKDRYAYEALNSEARLTKPMLRQCGEWREVDWQTALEFIGTDLKRVVREHGAASVGALASPHATLEELHLLQKFVRAAGSESIDCRLRQTDFSLDGKGVTPWLGLPVAEIAASDRVLVVGSFVRKDHPLLAQRLRQAAKKFTRVILLHVADDDQLIALHAKSIVAPSALAAELAGIVKAVAEAKGAAVDAALAGVQPSAAAKQIAESLASGEKGAIFLGNFAQQHAQAATLHALAQKLAELTGARFGYLGEAANSVGGYVAKAVPGASGLNAARMLAEPRKAYFVLHAEPELDCANPQQAMAALKGADLVVAMTPFKTRALDYAHVILPVAPFTETSGTFINTEGRVQSFHAVVKPLGETRPAWKVLRVLGNLLGLPGFEQDSSEAVRDEALGGKADSVAERLNNRADGVAITLSASAPTLQRVTDVPIHFADPLARRAPSLQKTRDAAPPAARMNAATLAKLGLVAGMQVKVSGGGTAILAAQLDAGLPDNCVRVAAGHPLTSGLGSMQGEITVERA
ncbi:MAG: NADH-quinone oxidoreductase subunit G [Rhodocyclales bacterium]|nr:NADH-quinone oxidoreductase subunit G [Rhodocyclales bacterium]